jgi:hypothetical protein
MTMTMTMTSTGASVGAWWARAHPMRDRGLRGLDRPCALSAGYDGELGGREARAEGYLELTGCGE